MQDHILLSYELIKGYSGKNWPPRYMIQIDMQKAYDSVEWRSVEIIFTRDELSSQVHKMGHNFHKNNIL